MNKSEISIVLGTYNRKKLLINCIKSIRGNGITVPYEIIAIDGGSDDGTAQWLVNQNDITTIIQHNRSMRNGQKIIKKSWGYFMNLGFKAAEAKYICMISDDCYLHEGAIMNAYALLNNDAGGIVGACAFPFRDSFNEDRFKVFKTFGDKILINHGMYRKDILVRVDWIDEDKYRFYKADSDLSLKIWELGYAIIVSKCSLVEHLHSDLDQVRLVNQVEAEKNNDIIKFEEYWKDRFGQQKYQPLIEMEAMEFWVPNELLKYIPKNISSFFCLVDMYLKKHISRESALFGLFKKTKRAFFKNRL